MKKKISLFVALVMALMVFTGCQGNVPTTLETPADESTAGSDKSEASETTDDVETVQKEIVWARAYESTSLDPAESADDESNSIVSYTTEGLVRILKDEVVPGIAESWDVSDDGMTYTFHLRESAWSDGTAVSAYDFEYSFFRLIDPAAGHSQMAGGFIVDKAREYTEGTATKDEVGFKAKDEYTIEITFANTGLENLYVLAGNEFHPVKKELAEQSGESYGSTKETVLGNGPMIIKEWSHENRIILEKNEQYWNADAIKVTKLTGLCNVSNDTAAEMMLTNSVDIAQFSDPTYYQQLYDAGFEGQTYCNTDQFIHINLKGRSEEQGRFLSNTNFRRALSYAIDRTAICNTVMLGQTPATRFIDPDAAGISAKFVDEYPVSTEINVTSDPENAKKYLALALDELGATIDDMPVFSMLCYDTQGNLTKLQAVQDMLLSVLNIQCTIDPQPIQQMIAKVYSGDFDFWSGGVSIGVMDAASSDGAFSYWDADNPDAHFAYMNTEYAKLLDEAQYATDRKSRYDALAKLEALFIDEVPSLLITWQTQHIVHRPGIVITSIDASYGADLAFADVQNKQK